MAPLYSGPKLTLRILSEPFAICRLSPSAPIPNWFAPSPLSSLTYTDNELSIIAPTNTMPSGPDTEIGWRALSVIGSLDFSLVGILASLIGPLAEASISILTVSTYDTDYILVRETQLSAAIDALGNLVQWPNDRTG